ncbi:hypothetical protein [Nocardioides sp. Leaf307]|uniref:hypothetical protein n=1 Tax=Nocardioides sp. Leaf307 TaxID=1736331 RepID=UPI0012EA2652|nr:hypothetical protein [Nocardioides sp. Leaf307]
MLNFLSGVPVIGEIIVAIAAAVAAFLLIRKVVILPAITFLKRVNGGMDTLLGYEAVLDPGSGKQLKEATPPLALRVDTLEEALTVLVENQSKMITVHERITALEEWRMKHVTWSEDVLKDVQQTNIDWQKEHEALHLLSHEVATGINKAPSP